MHGEKSGRIHAELLSVFTFQDLDFEEAERKLAFYFIDVCEVRNFGNEHLSFL